MRTVRASEIGSYLFCKRAWGYQRRGLQPENKAVIQRGTSFHRAHGRAVLSARLLSLAGWLLLLIALAVLVVALTLLVTG